MRSRWWWVYAVVTAVVILWCLVLPAGIASDALGLVIGFSSAAAIVVGVRLHRPSHPAAWWLMAAGQFAWSLGDAIWDYDTDIAHTEPFPSVADVSYLVGYPLVAAGLGLCVLVRRRGLDVPGLIDSAIVTAGFGLVSWVLLARPAIGDSSVSVLGRVIELSYPAADVLLLALLAWLVTTPGARTVAFRVLVAATMSLLVADLVFALQTLVLGDAPEDAGATSALWWASYGLWGVCALHPSMRELTERSDGAPTAVSRPRLAAMTAAVLAAPVTLGTELLLGVPLDGWAVVLASVVTFTLVVGRMHTAIRELTARTAQRDQLREDLVHQAAHDAMTALPNRARVLELVGAALHRAQRAGALVGVLFVDLDHFKAVNDTYGHAAGDEVLREVAARMIHQVRAGDVVGRLGGDEFVVLVESPGTEDALVDLADRLVSAISAPIVAAGREVVIGASIGVAVASDGTTSASALLHDADVAAYRAKSAGRGRSEVFDDDLRRELQERAELEAAIDRGLAGHEFVLHYQPVVDLGTSELTGYEALIRWQRPGHGLIAPDRFIPTAERSALVCDLGRWVLHEATGQLARWIAADPQRFARTTVAVNISGRHLMSPALLDDVTDALAHSGLRPDQLVLEITETVLVDEPLAVARMRALRDLGVSLSIDDFGTGYTSIGQLQHLSVDVLKIDRSFVGSTAPGARELVLLMVTAAHAIGLHVVAEGVETDEQLLPLQQMGCDSVQGYLFARPQPAEAISAEQSTEHVADVRP